MNKMFLINATEARKEWSSVIDNAIRQKPQFIKRTRDELVLSSVEHLKELLKPYKFIANKYKENDGSITLSLENIDLVENASTLHEAKLKLAEAIKEYSYDFYNDFEFWSSAPNRKGHIPYVIKTILIENIEAIAELIECQDGKN